MSVVGLCISRAVGSRFKPRLPRRDVSIAVLGACFDKGQPKEGAALGPGVIRKTGVFSQISALGHEVVDLGDVSLEDVSTQIAAVNDRADKKAKMLNSGAVGVYNKRLSSDVSSALKHHNVMVTLGGDHSIAIGTIHAHCNSVRDRQVGVLWVDAHADINTPLTSATGNFHGQPVSFLIQGLEDLHVDVPSLRWSQENRHRLLQPRQVVYIGLRDIDRPEMEVIRRLGITAYSMRDVDKLGIDKVTEMSLSQLDAHKCSLHVSFDIDSLDSLEAPSTGTPVRGGLTLREGKTIMEEVSRCGSLRCLDLVEVNPLLGSVGDVSCTVEAARHILLSTFGSSRMGRFPTTAEEDEKESR